MLVTPCGLRATEVVGQMLGEIDRSHGPASLSEKPLLFRGAKVADLRGLGGVAMLFPGALYSVFRKLTKSCFSCSVRFIWKRML
jgi:hypothetical protein